MMICLKPLLPDESFPVALGAQKPSVEENCLLLRLLTNQQCIAILVAIIVIMIVMSRTYHISPVEYS